MGVNNYLMGFQGVHHQHDMSYIDVFEDGGIPTKIKVIWLLGT